MSRFLILLCSDILSIATGWGFFLPGGGGRRLASGVKLQQKCKSSFMYVLICNLYNFICFMHVFFVCTMIFIILEQYIINGQTIDF